MNDHCTGLVASHDFTLDHSMNDQCTGRVASHPTPIDYLFSGWRVPYLALHFLVEPPQVIRRGGSDNGTDIPPAPEQTPEPAKGRGA